jgi:hypothetical protein
VAPSPRAHPDEPRVGGAGAHARRPWRHGDRRGGDGGRPLRRLGVLRQEPQGVGPRDRGRPSAPSKAMPIRCSG